MLHLVKLSRPAEVRAASGNRSAVVCNVENTAVAGTSPGVSQQSYSAIWTYVLLQLGVSRAQVELSGPRNAEDKNYP